MTTELKHDISLSVEDQLTALTDNLNSVMDQIKKIPSVKYESESINELSTALAKAQLAMGSAKKDAHNEFYHSNFADLKEVVYASREALAKNELSVTQRVLPYNVAGISMALHTRLMHSSGQWMESIIPLKLSMPKNRDGSPRNSPEIHVLGSYITYFRRYAYSAIVGVVCGDDDDDGNVAATAELEDFREETISKSECEVLGLEVGTENPNVAKGLLKAYGIDKLSQLKKKDYNEARRRTNKMKSQLKGA